MTPFHWIGDGIRRLLLNVPLWAVQMLFLLSIALVLIWVLRLPEEQVKAKETDARPGANLRFWACLALFLQLIIYWMD